VTSTNVAADPLFYSAVGQGLSLEHAKKSTCFSPGWCSNVWVFIRSRDYDFVRTIWRTHRRLFQDSVYARLDPISF
jgi:hypothetical protein